MSIGEVERWALQHDRERGRLMTPEEAEAFRLRAQAYQRLPPEERFRILAKTIDEGLRAIAASPHREEIERLDELDKEEWRRIQRGIFAKYGPKDGAA